MHELTSASLIAFPPTMDAARARLVYEGEIGLTFVADEPLDLILVFLGRVFGSPGDEVPCVPWGP